MSALLGLPDLLYPVLPRPKSLRFFTNGWGNVERCHEARVKRAGVGDFNIACKTSLSKCSSCHFLR